MDGMDECAKKKQRLCTKEEICPLGQNPSHGKYDKNMWARILDRNNDWVQIGVTVSPRFYTISFFVGKKYYEEQYLSFGLTIHVIASFLRPVYTYFPGILPIGKWL